MHDMSNSWTMDKVNINSFTSMKGEGGGDFQGDGGVDLYDDVITAPSSNDAPPSTDNRQVEVCRTTYQLSIVLQKLFSEN